MTRWVRKPLGSLAKLNYGYTESATHESVGPHFLRITDIQDNRVEWEKVPFCPITPEDQPKYRLHDGDIVFARTGATTGKSFLVREPPDAVFASYLIRVSITSKELLPDFVARFFDTPEYWREITNKQTGSAQGGFNASKLGALQIPLPPIPVQKRIAAILDAADALRAKRRESIERLDSLVQATFLEMFGDPVTNPNGWGTSRLPQLVSANAYSLKRGPFGGALKKEIFVEHGYKVYQQQNVIYDDFESGHYFIGERDYKRLRAFAISPGDLLVSCSGTIGRVAEVPAWASPGVMNQALLKIALDTSRCSTAFFLAHWRSEAFSRKVLGMTHGSGMKNMKSIGELKDISFISPPVPLQTRFASIVESIEQQKTRLKAHLAELDTLFASLQSRAFNGELVA